MTPTTQAGATSADETKTQFSDADLSRAHAAGIRACWLALAQEISLDLLRNYLPAAAAVLASRSPSPAVVPESVRRAYEAAELHECWVNGDKADVMTNPHGHCGNFDQIVARCATGDLWRKRAVAIATTLNWVRTLIADAPPSGRAAETRSCTCHPDDNPPVPCAGKYALSECKAASAPTPPASAGDVDGRIEKVTRALLDNRGFHYAEDPMEFGQNAYDITNETRAEAIVALNAMGLATAPAAPEPAAGGAPYGIIDPDYARIFTIARCLAWAEGYALMLHGSFTRDLDLLAVPWTERACEPQHLVRRIVAASDLRIIGDEPGQKPHGRLAWTLRFEGFGDPRFIDFSVMPRATPTRADAGAEERR